MPRHHQQATNLSTSQELQPRPGQEEALSELLPRSPERDPEGPRQRPASPLQQRTPLLLAPSRGQASWPQGKLNNTQAKEWAGKHPLQRRRNSLGPSAYTEALLGFAALLRLVGTLIRHSPTL